MDIKIFATSKINDVAPKEEFDKLGGIAAGVCYLPDTIETLINEDEEKTKKRIARTLASGHHSPYDHPQITLELVDIPKILAMILNNESMYTTSEKSARYKRMPLPAQEQTLYDKWLNIFKDQIKTTYQEKNSKYFTDSKIEKLAQENARYLTSVFTTTSMLYSISYRQFNNLIGFMQKEIEILKNNSDNFSKKLKSEITKLLDKFSELPYYDNMLADNRKNRELSLFRRNKKPIIKYFGDVYSLAYKGSFAQVAQAQRHRTLEYSIEMLEKPEFYIPPILKTNPDLVKEWLYDCNLMAENFPQGMLVNINEMGTLDNFILKIKERNCAEAQLEIDNQTTEIKKEMYQSLLETNHPRTEELKEYMQGSRCTFPDYKCENPCGFKDGVTGERII